MEQFSAQQRKWQIEVYLWQEQRKLEDQMVKDQQKVNGMIYNYESLGCPTLRADENDLKEVNFKKKLLKANLKIGEEITYILQLSKPGVSRQIKKDVKIFSADSDIHLLFDNNDLRPIS